MKLENENDFGGCEVGSLYSRRRTFADRLSCHWSASSTQQSASNAQTTVGNAAQGSQQLAIGSGSTGNTINVTSSDAATSQAAILGNTITTTAALGTAAGAVTSEAETAAHAEDIAGAVALHGIDSSAMISGAAIGVANNSLALVAQNQASTAAEINNNTSLAFSTIDHLITGQAAGQQAAANEAASAQLAAAQSYGQTLTGGGQAAQPVIINEPTGTSGTSGGLFTSSSTYNFVWIIAGGLTIWYFLKGKKAA